MVIPPASLRVPATGQTPFFWSAACPDSSAAAFAQIMARYQITREMRISIGLVLSISSHNALLTILDDGNLHADEHLPDASRLHRAPTLINVADFILYSMF